MEELYNGNIYPDRKSHAPDSDFVRYTHIKSENLDKLKFGVLLMREVMANRDEIMG